MAVNVELLTKVMEHIEGNPEEHDQSQWARQTECGTKYCFAGHTVFMSGWTPEFDEDSTAAFCVSGDNEQRCIESLAKELLGLSGYQAERLFFECEDLPSVRRYVGVLLMEAE